MDPLTLPAASWPLQVLNKLKYASYAGGKRAFQQAIPYNVASAVNAAKKFKNGMSRRLWSRGRRGTARGTRARTRTGRSFTMRTRKKRKRRRRTRHIKRRRRGSVRRIIKAWRMKYTEPRQFIENRSWQFGSTDGFCNFANAWLSKTSDYREMLEDVRISGVTFKSHNIYKLYRDNVKHKMHIVNEVSHDIEVKWYRFAARRNVPIKDGAGNAFGPSEIWRAGYVNAYNDAAYPPGANFPNLASGPAGGASFQGVYTMGYEPFDNNKFCSWFKCVQSGTVILKPQQEGTLNFAEKTRKIDLQKIFHFPHQDTLLAPANVPAISMYSMLAGDEFILFRIRGAICTGATGTGPLPARLGIVRTHNTMYRVGFANRATVNAKSVDLTTGQVTATLGANTMHGDDGQVHAVTLQQANAITNDPDT